MTYSGLCRFQMTLATILTDLMGAAVFERFPNIRIVLRRERHRLDPLRASTAWISSTRTSTRT